MRAQRRPCRQVQAGDAAACSCTAAVGLVLCTRRLARASECELGVPGLLGARVVGRKGWEPPAGRGVIYPWPLRGH